MTTTATGTSAGGELDVERAGRVFTDPSAYADPERFHAACALLRREAPVHRFEIEGFNPFWAITRYADLMDIERRTDVWAAEPRPALGPAAQDAKRGDIPIRSLVQMDPPDHTTFRLLTADYFKPASLSRLDDQIADLSKRSVDAMAAMRDEAADATGAGRCDFVTDVALHYPLQVILSLLGLPEQDFPRMLQLTQELFGNVDPELARERDPDMLRNILLDFAGYFTELTNERRANPTDDLASVIANARIDGAPIGDLEAIGYYVIVATAGHDTTSATIAGGLLALLQHPDQLALLRERPELVNTAVEEMIRWEAPVKQFMRTAKVDVEVGGVTIPAGDAVLLSFPSASRDEEVLDRADEFDVTRDPNRHMAFGFGAHYCLGAQLARIEARAFFRELLPRLRSIELAGEPEYARTLFVGGLKHLPIRYELA